MDKKTKKPITEFEKKYILEEVKKTNKDKFVFNNIKLQAIMFLL